MKLTEAAAAITAIHDQVRAIIRDTEQEQRAGARAYWEYQGSLTLADLGTITEQGKRQHEAAYGAWGRFYDAVGDLIECLKQVETFAGEEDDAKGDAAAKR